MSTESARAAHERLLDRLRSARTTAELRAIMDTITHLDRPGFPFDLPDGEYFDGVFIATFRGGQNTMSYVLDWITTERELWEVWGALAEERTEERRAEREARREAIDAERAKRRGRPEIGRPIQVRMPDWLRDQVERYADARDMPRAEAARELILAGLRAKREEGR